MSAVFVTLKQRRNAETKTTDRDNHKIASEKCIKMNLISFFSKGHGHATLRTLAFDIMLNLFA